MAKYGNLTEEQKKKFKEQYGIDIESLGKVPTEVRANVEQQEKMELKLSQGYESYEEKQERIRRQEYERNKNKKPLNTTLDQEDKAFVRSLDTESSDEYNYAKLREYAENNNVDFNELKGAYIAYKQTELARNEGPTDDPFLNETFSFDRRLY